MTETNQTIVAESGPVPAIPPILGLFLGILAVSTASIFIRFAQAEVPSLVIAAGRLTIATLVLAPLALWKKGFEYRNIQSRDWLLLTLAGVFLGFHFVSWITSLEYTTIASSVVLVTTAPLWVAFFSPLLLKEKVSIKVIFGLIISLVGSLVVGISSNCDVVHGAITCSGLEEMFNGRHFTGNLLALLGAFLSGGYLIAGRKVRNSISLPLYTFIVYGIASLVLILLVLITGEKINGFSTPSYFWIFALALIPQVIGHSAFNWALKYLSAAFVSIALLGEPVGTVLLAYLFLKESPTILEIMGGIFILAGIFIASQTIKRRRET